MHGGAWERAKEALRRDWEQTKHDFGSKTAPDLDQDVGDTVKQAFGKQPIDDDFAAHEEPIGYGYAAYMQYGTQYPNWDEKLESTLKSEWEEGHRIDKRSKKFEDVRDDIRRGYVATHV
jgi:hypothetical protein